MSFFDEGDPPSRRAPRPRRPAVPRAGASTDHQTLMVRRGVAAGIAILVLILLVVGIRGCVNSSKQRGLRDYARNVSSLVQESNDQVSRPFFETLNKGGANAVALQNQVNGLRATADDLVKRAHGLDVPDQVKAAQSAFLLVLELRRDALGRIAEKLPTALGRDNADVAIAQIAGQMSAFLASDVVYSQRVIPGIESALAGAGIAGVTVARSQFLPDIKWLDETQLASTLGASVRPAGGTVTPGTHGHGLLGVSAGAVTLTPGAANRIPAGTRALSVKFANQGENDEFNVTVKVTITPTSGKPIVSTTRVPQTKAGAETTVDVPLKSTPPAGSTATITVEVLPVPGEKKTDNNSQTYQSLFQ